jgi:hypothetical protein
MSSTITALTSGGGLAMAGDTSGQLELKTNNGTTAVTISTAQNIGMGDPSPTGVRLTCFSNGAGSEGQLKLGYDVSAYWQLGRKDTAGAGSGNFQFKPDGGKSFVDIDTSGNTYFNYGSATQLSAPSGVSVAGPVNVPLQIYMLKETQVEAHIGFKSSTDTNFYVGTSGGISGIGAYGLYQQNVTNSWTSVSDERVKTELEPITDALSKVANVRTLTGRFTFDEENGVTRRLPFLIAQDFLEALPEAVDTQNPDKLGLSYSDTVVLAFAAIKELKAQVDAQALEIQALKGVA